MKNLALILLTLIFISCITSCYNNKYDQLYPAKTAASTCDTTAIISYSQDIAPIVATNCYSPGNGCHDAAGSGVSGYNYTSYSGLIVNIPDGALLNDINWTPLRGGNDMPKNGNQLTQCDIDKITKWINEGYPDN